MAVTNELKEAIKAMQKGDAEGFAKVYEATHDYVYAKAKYIMKSEQDALDLTQETYIQAYKGIVSLEDLNNVYAWLGGIVYRQGMKMFGKNRDVLTGEEQDYIFEEIEASDAAPEEAADRQATVDIVKGMIDELPELQKVAILSFYYDNMKIEDIAQMCECSANTIKSRLNYAKKYLKTKVEEHERQNRYKLCSISPALLLLVFKELFAELEYKMPANAVQKVYAASCASAGVKAVSLSAANASASAVAGTTVTAAKTGLAIKIGATIAAIAVAGSIGAAVVRNMNTQPKQPAIVEQKTEDDKTDSEVLYEASNLDSEVLDDTNEVETQEDTETAIYDENIPMEGLFECGEYSISITNVDEVDWNDATFDMELTYHNLETGEIEIITGASLNKVNGMSDFDETSNLGNRWFGTLMFMSDNSVRVDATVQNQDGDAWDISRNGSIVIMTKDATEGKIHGNRFEEGSYSAKGGGFTLEISEVSDDSLVMKFEILYDSGRIDGYVPDMDFEFINDGVVTFAGTSYWEEAMYGYMYVNDDGSITLSYSMYGNTDGCYIIFEK